MEHIFQNSRKQKSKQQNKNVLIERQKPYAGWHRGTDRH